MIAIIIYVISPANKPARRHSVPTYPALPYNCFFYVTDLPMNFPKTAASLLLLLASLAAHALDTGRIPQNEIAVYVQELDSGKVIIDHRSDVPVNPASTMKLVTAFAAFKTFGSNYRWATEFKSNGTINDGTLDGNLYWAGSGDPVFNQENLLAVQRQLREQGIRNITGHLMLDHSLWGEVGSPDDFEADSGSPFMTPPQSNYAVCRYGYGARRTQCRRQYRHPHRSAFAAYFRPKQLANYRLPSCLPFDQKTDACIFFGQYAEIARQYSRELFGQACRCPDVRA